MIKYLVLGMLVLAGCSSDGTEPELPPRVTISASTNVVRSGEPLPLSVTVINQSSSAIDVTGAAGTCPTWFDVSRDGQLVGPPRPTCPSGLPAPRIIEPRTSATLAYSWRAEVTSAMVPNGITRLPAGTYQLRGRVLIGSRLVTSDSSITLVIFN